MDSKVILESWRTAGDIRFEIKSGGLGYQGLIDYRPEDYTQITIWRSAKTLEGVVSLLDQDLKKFVTYD